ncbi:hypothetical protein Tco_0790649 [Tanacetum coccineum]
MAAHTERLKRFENAIFKQRGEINDRMTEMFGLLMELTTSRALKKYLIREEARHPVTKNVNFISLIRGEEKKKECDDNLQERISEDVLVDVAGYVYPVDFVILDIKEDEKRPFILRTPFLTTVIFDEKKLGSS